MIIKKVLIILTAVLIPLFFAVNGDAQTTIQMKKSPGGTYTLPCKVNGLAMEFMLDTGASDVSISLTEAVFMLRHGYLTADDIVGVEKYSLADGSVQEGDIVIFREMEIGGLKLYNVRASVVREELAPLLLGQSALNKLGKIEIDYANNTLIIRSGSVTGTATASKPAQPVSKSPATAKPATTSTSQNGPPITIVNETGYPIYFLYISNIASDSWGTDRLGADIISNGRSATVNLPYPLDVAKSYDIRVVDSDGDSYTKWNVLVQANSRIVFKMSDFDVLSQASDNKPSESKSVAAPSTPSAKPSQTTVTNFTETSMCRNSNDFEFEYVSGIFIEKSSRQPANGLICSFYISGKLWAERPFANGLREGIVREYYESGKLWGETPYKNGRKEGFVKEYYESGNLKRESFYIKDVREGFFREYYESGKLFIERPYINSVREGIERIYYETGKLFFERPYIKDVREGIVRVYYESGKLGAVLLYNKGKTLRGYCANGRMLTNTELIYIENGHLFLCEN